MEPDTGIRAATSKVRSTLLFHRSEFQLFHLCLFKLCFYSWRTPGVIFTEVPVSHCLNELSLTLSVISVAVTQPGNHRCPHHKYLLPQSSILSKSLERSVCTNMKRQSNLHHLWLCPIPFFSSRETRAILNPPHPQTEHTMDYTLALLFSLLQVFSLCSAAPVPPEVVILKSKVKWMAEQLVDRLDKDFRVRVVVLFVTNLIFHRNCSLLVVSLT